MDKSTDDRKFLTVWKYPIPPTTEVKLSLPRGAKLLYVAEQHQQPHAWFLVDPSADRENRYFWIAGTGHPIPEDVIQAYAGSFQLMGGGFVGHIFERKPKDV